MGSSGYDIGTHFILVNNESVVFFRGRNEPRLHIVRLYRIDLPSLQTSHVDIESSYNLSTDTGRDFEGLCADISAKSFVCLANQKLLFFDDKLTQLSQTDLPTPRPTGLQVVGENELLLRTVEDGKGVYRWWKMSEPLSGALKFGPVNDEGMAALGLGDLLVERDYHQLFLLNGPKPGATVCDDAICDAAIPLLIPATKEMFLFNSWGMELLHSDLTLTKLSAARERCGLNGMPTASLLSPRFAVDVGCKLPGKTNDGSDTGRSSVRIYDSTTGLIVSQFRLKEMAGWEFCMNAEGTKLAAFDGREIKIFVIDLSGQK